MKRNKSLTLALFVAFLVTSPGFAAERSRPMSVDRWLELKKDQQARFQSTMSARADDSTIVGEPPEGFGERVFWDRAETNAHFIIFVNPADHLGVLILNLKKGDKVELVSASGQATFSKGHGALVSSIIKLVQAGGIALLPEAAPVINEGAKYAQEQFGKPGEGKQRDAFGIDEDGDFQRCEGGVILCMPSAGMVYYSTEGCVSRKWIRNPVADRMGIRANNHIYDKVDWKYPRHIDVYPKHVKHARFLVPPDRARREDNKYILEKDGGMYVAAWDRKFDDNKGHYMVHLRITREDAVPLPIVD